ncbi:GH92 family glycosyl hydrolase [Rhizobium tubonense]|uniref:GH92 family glycosyl hydrolase n=1 Tax=Rhizobium tubonense TaxID=484088 RepID=UPI0019D498E0|nr:GH92 family glycosyl hydrolase [Rhizobium tubonense]
MKTKGTFIVSLLSCTMLVGCNDSKKSAEATPPAPSTFTADAAKPDSGAQALGLLTTEVDALKRDNIKIVTAYNETTAAQAEAEKTNTAALDEARKATTAAAMLAEEQAAKTAALAEAQKATAAALDEAKKTIAATAALAEEQKAKAAAFAEAQMAIAAALDETQEKLLALEARSDADHKKAMALTLWKMSAIDVPAVSSKLPLAQANRAALAALEPGIGKATADIATVRATPDLPQDVLDKLNVLLGQANVLQAEFTQATKADGDMAKVFSDVDSLTASLATAANDPDASAALAERLAATPRALDDVTKLLSSHTADFTTRLTAINDSVEFLRPRADVALTQFVNPFIGTQITETGGGHSGNVNPGAQTPFGMVSFGPDTRGSGQPWGYGSGGYYYSDTTIQFFDLTHLNGPGCRGQGAVAMLPADTATQSLSSGAAYAHTDEAAEPGYYKVKFGNGITTELTATTRTGTMRLTYADAAKAFLIMNMKLNNSGAKYSNGVNPSLVDIKIGADSKSISGNAVASAFCDGTWAQPVYFYATFNKPLKSTSATDAGGDVATLQFDLADADKTVDFRVGISSVSIDNAKLNLDTENSALSFAEIKKQISDNWNHRLNTIQLDLSKPGAIDKLATPALKTAATENLKKFYTAFYRVFSGPTVYSDVNGDYRSMKQNDLTAAYDTLSVRDTANVSQYPFKIDGKDAGYKTHYSGFSMWDTYRSGAQLVALVAPDEASEMMQSLVADAQQCGAFPHWVDGSEDTIPMQGDHALNVIAGSYAFGAKKFDLAKARDFVRQSVFDPTSHCNNKLSEGRNADKPALPGYLSLGYIATDATPAWNASSATVEMITSDRSAGAFLSKLPSASSDQADIAGLFLRAKNWTNIFDDSASQIKLRAKNKAGVWQNGNFHEGTEPHYLWAFAHDWTALIGKLGGKAAAITRLNTLFSFDNSKPFKGTEPTGSNLNAGEGGTKFYIGNEPSFQTPWAYNWAGAPKYGQYVIPVIMRKNFSLNPGGLPGNDDMGATSAWYVLAALGLYPVIPSEAGLAVSTPQFSGITLWLGNGRKVRIGTDKQAMLDDVRYISEMKLNGAVYQGSWLPLEKIADGGQLKYTLSAEPTEWGAGDALTPPSGPGADYSKATAAPPAVQMIQ